jgi:tagatose 1,6-diphosphate aldolase
MTAGVESLEKMDLRDAELRLLFTHVTPVSEPDTGIPAYCFSMRNASADEVMGGINIKAGYTENIIKYRGNIGFTVFEQFRGRHYSARSCLLLVPVLKMLGMNPIWITCNADNHASRSNIERIGAEYQETLTIPNDYQHLAFYPEHARIKMRYKWELK